MACIATDKARTILVAALCVIATTCAWERPTSSFANWGAAVDSGMVAAGWLPAWIPTSATRLEERHDIDSNTVILRFEFDSSIDRPPFFKGCKIAPPHLVESPTLHASWWPDTDTLMSMHRLYECDRDNAYLAIPAESGTAYFWSNPA